MNEGVPKQEGGYVPGDYRIEVSLEDVRESIVAALPGLEAYAIKVEGRGRGNIGFSVNGEYLFRFAKHEKANEENECLEKALTILNEHITAVPMPAIEYSGTSGEGHAFVGYKMLKGEELSSPTPRVTEQFAFLVKELRDINIQEFADAGLNLVGGGREDFDDRLKAIESNLYPYIETHYPEDFPQVREYINSLFRTHLDDPENFAYEPAVLHGDLEGKHILYDEKTDSISGVIDWGDVRIGDPDYELWRPYSTYGKEFILELLKHMPHKEPERLFRKLDFWFRGHVAYRVMRSAKLGDYELAAQKYRQLRKQALGLGYWYPEIRGKKVEDEESSMLE